MKHLSERAAYAALFTLAILIAFVIAFTTDIIAAKAAGSQWTGCYVGAGGGYSMLDSKTSVGATGVGDYASVDGLAAEGVGLYAKAGCDVELLPKWVVGAFGDYDWQSNTDFSVNVLGAPGDLVKASLDSSWTVGGRAGYLVKPDALLYVLVGYTQAQMSDISFPAFPGTPSLNVPDLKGIVYGAGVDLALGKGWFAQAEGRWANYDRKQIDVCGGCGEYVALDADVLSARVGLAYKFNFNEREITVPFTAEKPLK
jgi:outer membrane immunogenic protein